MATTKKVKPAAESPVADPAVSTVAAPVAAPPATVKAAAKVAPKRPASAAKVVDEKVRAAQAALAETLAKAQAQAEKAVKAKAAAPAERPAKVSKPKKPRLVRDSFTMPDGEYVQLAALKKRLAGNGVAAKKSELLRAGLALLAALKDAELTATLAKVEKIKTGRPAKSGK